MTAPFLRTKLHIPTAHRDLLPRPRLTDRLAAGLAGRVILVSAPAGFGKTTLSLLPPVCGVSPFTVENSGS